MSRLDGIRTLYELLDELTASLGGARTLRECHGRMGWPNRGVYFFFEEGERRTTSGSGPRVVRVGTHGLTSKSRATLWGRLAQHRGVASGGHGNHRGSIFRLLVGEALARRERLDLSTWGSGSSLKAAAKIHRVERADVGALERPLEARVSALVGEMPFVWLAVDDAPGPESLRGLVERNCIALLSNAGREAIDPPSTAWLGRESARPRVRDSGLWNNDHTEAHFDPAFLLVLARLVREAGGATRSSSALSR